MLILGNGLTAMLALKCFPDSTAIAVSEPRDHKALLRFRTDAISKLTGIPFKKVRVHKAVWSDGNIVEPNIRLANIYSKKVSGGIYSRSILNCAPADRFIAPPDFAEQLREDVGDRIEIVEDYDQYVIKSESQIISTIPMYDLKMAIGYFPTPEMEAVDNASAPIYVTRYKLKNTDVYQTLYIASENNPIYRITIEGDIAIIESMDLINEDKARTALYILNIDDSEILSRIYLNYKQSVGKMVPMDELDRQTSIAKLTRVYDIYSLGRVACWRPSVLLDDVLEDIYKIRDMIQLTPYERAMRWK